MEFLTTHFLDNNLYMVVLGFFGYFFLEFKSRAQLGEKFSFPVWIQGNWYNVGITIVAVIAYYQLFKPLTMMEAFAIGLLPNIATDWLQDFIAKMKSKHS